ncbi:MAG: hypothetical protein HUK15_10185 [Bacteroidales bacterium]|nr:hypothetical protein [Bacteroidales bacterium]
MSFRNITILILISLGIFSCKRESEQVVTEKYVVSFENEHLTERELIKAISPYFDEIDSAKLANEYIEDWLTEKSLFCEAKKLLTDTSDIVDKTNKYRRQLYAQEYCNNYIYSNVNNNVTEKEIEEYYNQHLNDYVINTAYVKAHYITFPARIVRYYEIYDFFRKTDLESEQILGDYCAGDEREAYFVKDWVELQDFLKLIKYKIPVQERELKSQGTMDFVIDTIRCLVKIDDIIVPGDLLPIELARPRIIQIIMNERRHEKYIQAKDELLNKYKSNGTIKYD